MRLTARLWFRGLETGGSLSEALTEVQKGQHRRDAPCVKTGGQRDAAIQTNAGCLRPYLSCESREADIVQSG